MRRQVQRHVGLLSVSYYDENRTGTLVARIMTDVEGVRNLVGTGLVEFVGGLFTAILAFVYLLHLSASVTLTAFAVMGAFVFVLQYAFRVIRPIFRERGKINAEVTGRLTESLGGVRVIKGYHAEEREAGVFAEGVGRLLDNVMTVSYTHLDVYKRQSLSCSAAKAVRCVCAASICSMERPSSTSSHTSRIFQRKNCAAAGWPRPKREKAEPSLIRRETIASSKSVILSGA